MPHRLEIASTIADTRAASLQIKLTSLGIDAERLHGIEVVDVLSIDRQLDAETLELAANALSNPLMQQTFVDQPYSPTQFEWAIEIGYLPGVTDNIGHTAQQIVESIEGKPFPPEAGVYSAQLIFLQGMLLPDEISRIALALSNPLIQSARIKSRVQFAADGGMGKNIPKVVLHAEPRIDNIEIDLDEQSLITLGKKGIADKTPEGTVHYRGPLALSLEAMQAIKAHFLETEQRNPTDAELEMLAQTWSEHCKHTIFAAPIDEISDGLYRHYIKRATQEIRQSRGEADICVSVFSDNSGGIVFDDDYLITDKVETHNSPSALDPYGGAITGIVGVNRDCIGFGLGARPIINRYGFCLADPREDTPLYRGENKAFPMLSPRRILDGVVKGVADGGNQSGIPAPQGFLYFDPRYRGKPLVFAGTVGIIPRTINGQPSHIKQAQPGDKIVMVGGRVGKDGIHGATFSSEALDTGSPVTAVQIGDPITQKKFSDALVKEARDLGLYSAITDNGAGGLSSSIGEMAREIGGCVVNLEKVPLKYPGLQPWEIWISESQERMTLAVPPDKIAPLFSLLSARSVEATEIGEFTDSGRCVVHYAGQRVIDLGLEFLHDGVPLLPQTTKAINKTSEDFDPLPPEEWQQVFADMIARPNCASFRFVSEQYDHVVQGTAVLQPLQGCGRVNADATVLRPLITDQTGKTLPSPRGIITTQALFPRYSDLDCHAMAACAIDAAMRQALCVGGKLDHLALLDNFCWCSADEPERLHQLKEAVRACYDYAVAYGTPFISGKDSMFNDFKGFDANGDPIKISIPPTLLISALGVMTDVGKAVSLDPKLPEDGIYILGLTKNELGGSEYADYLRPLDSEKAVRAGIDSSRPGRLPTVDAAANLPLYRALEQAIDKELVASAISLGHGGLGVSLMKMAVASGLGMEVELAGVPQEDLANRSDLLLFSESTGRVVVTVSPENQAAFEALFSNIPWARIGQIIDAPSLHLTTQGETLASLSVQTLHEHYHGTFGGF